jgi:hypothetical protein
MPYFPTINRTEALARLLLAGAQSSRVGMQGDAGHRAGRRIDAGEVNFAANGAEALPAGSADR